MGQMYFPGEERTSRPSNNHGNWGCWFVVAVILVIIFCIYTSSTNSSTDELVEDADSIEYVEVVDSIAIQQEELSSSRESGNKEKTTPIVDYSSIANTIKGWNTLNMVSVTETGSAVAVYKNNGYTYQNISDGLVTQLKKINSNGWIIQDVNLVSKESFVIVYGTNGYWAVGAPTRFSDKLKQFHDNKETILSACFNSNQEWCIITNKHYSYSNEQIKQFCNNAESKYGHINYVFLSDEGIVACCDGGTCWSNIPESASKAINDFKYNIKIVKFTDSGRYCIASGNGGSSFRL